MRQRVDQLLVARGLVRSRAEARDLVRRGAVTADGAICDKPGRELSPDAVVAVTAGAGGHVSRGALKLAAALDAFGMDPAGLVALDVGASTGGFTETLLARGAARVHAVDIGRAQLAPVLRGDDRVVVHEGFDARQLTRAQVPEPIDLIVADVSFVSLTIVLPAALALAGSNARLVALVKPQFEAGRAAVGKGGIVRREEDRRAAVARVRAWIEGRDGWRVAGVVQSPIPGKGGNVEFLLGARRDG